MVARVVLIVALTVWAVLIVARAVLIIAWLGYTPRLVGTLVPLSVAHKLVSDW